MCLKCLFKTFSFRINEDLDFVQVITEPIGETIDAIRQTLDVWLGEPKRKLTERGVKLVYRFLSVENIKSKLKIEINTTEHFHIEPLRKYQFVVSSNWFNVQVDVVSYSLDELMGTKLRALHQLRKGRDLFDLWYVCQKSLIDVGRVISVFEEHGVRNSNPISRAMFEKSLHSKKSHLDFQSDIIPLLSPGITWDFDSAVGHVEETFVSKLQGEPWRELVEQ